MNSKDLTFTSDSEAFLVAGRRLNGAFPDGAFERLCAAVDQLAAELQQPLVVLPAGDFTDTGVPIAEQATAPCAVGLLVRRADTYGSEPFRREDVVAALENARTLPWAAISDLAAPHHELADEVAMHLTACGPLAGGMVGYGVVVTLREEEDMYWDEDDEQNFLDDPDGAAAITPGLEIVRGNMMSQEPQYDAIYGVQVARALHEGPIPIMVDFSEAAHRERIERLGELAAQSTYHLIGHFS
ncbi:hypothetical protein [Kutzneria sp. CA-103260]|uniref:hypothetical protein n=1 Tax=Kutzneria sp. CA-103260 TaxID=2802641 RepID=UPI001BA8CBBC|nr:hypothetical protein [Kutzneria sp. CA-103260]QUQ65623.1 hypothetical protein JJ691_33470 [Kutzneria sp. CA-103260]